MRKFFCVAVTDLTVQFRSFKKTGEETNLVMVWKLGDFKAPFKIMKNTASQQGYTVKPAMCDILSNMVTI